MKRDFITINELNIPVYSLNTVIVGSGAAGFNAADSLYQLGQKDIAIVTEGINAGTSRNTGSDKQTYYKLSLSGSGPDSVTDLAKTLFNGGAKHGDIATVEAALSTQSFYKLVSLGVPFPTNELGEYVGYKTDHDPRQRATSAGPLTSKFMVEKLEQAVKLKEITIFDKHHVIGILSDGMNAFGLIAINKEKINQETHGLTLFNCTNIIYATGGPAGMYEASVYPKSQTGSLGIAFEAGVKGVNLTESQFGIASTKFRWNLSGTYQQVIPRYISTNVDGSDEREFLLDYLQKDTVFNQIFLKGYEWPFDIRKVNYNGSSMIDLLVYQETYIKGRKVYLDYRKNPRTFHFDLLNDVSNSYLKQSNALLDTPIKRLRTMNEPAYQLYLSHGIDLETCLLEINVCNQHCNGGLIGDINFESNLKHFFPVGEANGSHGIYRPGGSALNSTQVGSLRASQYINQHYKEYPLDINTFKEKAFDVLKDRLNSCEKLMRPTKDKIIITDALKTLKTRMSKYGAFIRNDEFVKKAKLDCQNDLLNWTEKVMISAPSNLVQAFQYYDLLITQFTFLSAIEEYINHKGCSRGSALIHNENGVLPLPDIDECFRYEMNDNTLENVVCEVTFKQNHCEYEWNEVRQIPDSDQWFENVWKSYRERMSLDE